MKEVMGILEILFQKQPPEVSCEVFLKISQISQENTCVRISLQAFTPATLLKTDSTTGVLPWNLQNFKNTYFEENLWTTASFICSLF